LFLFARLSRIFHEESFRFRRPRPGRFASQRLLRSTRHRPPRDDIVDDKEVTKMSIAMFRDMKSHYKPSRDRELNAQLKRVGERLQSAISIWDMPDADWEFVVFDVPNQINAFAMAGGKVGVFTSDFLRS